MEGYIDKDIRLAILGRPEESYLEKIKSYFRENYPGEASIWDLRDDWDRICPITPSQEQVRETFMVATKLKSI